MSDNESDFFAGLADFFADAANIAWGLPLILMLGGVGLFYTIRLGFPQFRRFWHAVAIGRGKYDEEDDPGEVTHFQALCAALSATVGVGNIGGVATAIWWGGPGAAVWMAIFGLFGMTTKFASCTLSLRYRIIDDEGHILGGPMESLTRGLGKNFRWLAVAFAICGVIASFGGGNMVQANEMANAFTNEFAARLPAELSQDFTALGVETNALKIILGLSLAAVVGMVIIGGIKRIGQVAGVLVPVMAVFYVGGALTVIFLNLDRVPGMIGEMISFAFTGGDVDRKITGGAVGFTMLQALTWGAKRAVFSNEAGLGSAPIAHAAAKTKEPVREGLIAMLGPFVDTVLICMMTALIINLTGAAGEFASGDNGAVITKKAFEMGMPDGWDFIGRYTVSIGLILFATSTAISWSYYGDRCVTFLFGTWAVMPYRVVYVSFLFVGANISGGAVWKFADVANAAMAFWHIVGLIGLSSVVVLLYKDYFSRPQRPTR